MEENKFKKQIAEKDAQINQLQSIIQQQNYGNMLKRLEFLFRVVENHEVFKPSNAEFLEKCVEEIKDTLTVEKE